MLNRTVLISTFGFCDLQLVHYQIPPPLLSGKYVVAVEKEAGGMTRLSGNRGGVVKVLLIIFGVLFLCVVIGGIYIAMHMKEWAADFAKLAAQELIKESGLPEDQRTAILGEIQQLADDYKSGKISTEELTRVAKTIGESPLIPLAGVQVARHKYIDPSDMTEQEKADAILAVQRVA